MFLNKYLLCTKSKTLLKKMKVFLYLNSNIKPVFLLCMYLCVVHNPKKNFFWHSIITLVRIYLAQRQYFGYFIKICCDVFNTCIHRQGKAVKFLVLYIPIYIIYCDIIYTIKVFISLSNSIVSSLLFITLNGNENGKLQ